MFLLLIAANCWLWMQGVHELGHVIAAKLSGGSVSKVVWWPTSISRTDVDPNPHPLIVCWSGPLFGSLLPLIAAMWLAAAGRRSSAAKFFAGFCLIANGAYLSVGSIDGVGDAGTLLSLGAPVAVLWSVGGVFVFGGLLIWHRLGRATDVLRCAVSVRECGRQLLLLLATISVMVLCFAAE
ncbi:MAG: hypothetical protein R3C19_19720 [Planctomycetaceae bacterium]